jgi:YegS/Rv2252/BmrU family lipid kinase
VVAVGGDGTMNEVASGLVGTETALGLIPRGSGNGYARSLKIPLKAEEAIDVLKFGQLRKVDVGQVNQYYFFNVMGVGFDAYIGAKFQDFGLRGPIPYFYIGFKGWFQYDFEAFTLRFNDKVLNLRPLLITVANTPQYGMSALIAPQASIDDGILDLCILEKMNILQALPRLHRLFDGTVEKVPFYKHYSVKEVIIEREKDRGLFHTDGEPRMGGKELNISILPLALKVIVPSGENEK